MPEDNSLEPWQSQTEEAAPDVNTELTPVVETTDSSAVSENLAWEEERQALLGELAQARSQQQTYLERINQLEQVVEELTEQLTDQKLLETELAAAEEVTSIQEQALGQLRQQITEQQETSQIQIAQAEEKEQEFDNLLINLDTFADVLQTELATLRSELITNQGAIASARQELAKQFTQRQTDLEAHQQQLWQLESQVVAARILVVRLELQISEQEQRVDELHIRLSDRNHLIRQLEIQLKQAQAALEAQKELQASLNETQELVKEQSATIKDLSKKIESLENQLTRHIKIQVRLQEACQELTDQCDDYHHRTTELERQKIDLQQQILLNSQQTNEAQTAIQRWKERYNEVNAQFQQLKELVERVMQEKPEELAELLPAIGQPVALPTESEGIQPAPETPLPTLENETEIKTHAKPRPIDLPGFLNNQQRVSRPQSQE